MTDKPFDHEEYSRERLRQTTYGCICHQEVEQRPECGGTPACYAQTTPGAGEGERWAKEFRPGMGLFVVQSTEGRIVAIGLLEADADLIVKLHNAREADQQTIADLRAETERWQEFATGYMRDLTAAEQALAAERERADGLESSVYSWQDDYEKLTAAFEECAAALQAEREKSAEAARAYLAMQKTSEKTWRAEVERLEEALRQVAAVPGPDLTNRAAANIARAALAALLSPALADAAHEEETP
jgi:hypothetical protein